MSPRMSPFGSLVVGKALDLQGDMALIVVHNHNDIIPAAQRLGIYHAGKGNGNELSLVNAIKYAARMANGH